MLTKTIKRSYYNPPKRKPRSIRLEIMPVQDEKLLESAAKLHNSGCVDAISVVCKENELTLGCVAQLADYMPSSAIKPHISLLDLHYYASRHGISMFKCIERFGEKYHDIGVTSALVVRGDTRYVKMKASDNDNCQVVNTPTNLGHSAQYLYLLNQYLRMSATCYPNGHQLNTMDAARDAKEKVEKGADELITQVTYETDTIAKFVQRLTIAEAHKLRISVSLSETVQKFAVANNIIFPEEAKKEFAQGRMIHYLGSLISSLNMQGHEKFTIASLNKLDLVEKLLNSLEKPQNKAL